MRFEIRYQYITWNFESFTIDDKIKWTLCVKITMNKSLVIKYNQQDYCNVFIFFLKISVDIHILHRKHHGQWPLAVRNPQHRVLISWVWEILILSARVAGVFLVSVVPKDFHLLEFLRASPTCNTHTIKEINSRIHTYT